MLPARVTLVFTGHSHILQHIPSDPTGLTALQAEDEEEDAEEEGDRALYTQVTQRLAVPLTHSVRSNVVLLQLRREVSSIDWTQSALELSLIRTPMGQRKLSILVRCFARVGGKRCPV